MLKISLSPEKKIVRDCANYDAENDKRFCNNDLQRTARIENPAWPMQTRRKCAKNPFAISFAKHNFKDSPGPITHSLDGKIWHDGCRNNPAATIGVLI
jgi:hypothetical protein